MKDWNWKNILIGFGIAVALLLHPLSRRIILFILPLGRGIDDLIFWIVAFVFIILLIARGWAKWNVIADVFRFLYADDKIKQSIMIALGILIMSFTPAGTYIYRWFFLGETFEVVNPGFFIPVIVSILVVIFGKKILEKFNRKGLL